jgi:hypothetical protein
MITNVPLEDDPIKYCPRCRAEIDVKYEYPDSWYECVYCHLQYSISWMPLEMYQ